jgi:hypothetical protein
MTRLRATIAICVLLAGVSSISYAESPPSCKPVERYGVKGCELLPGQTCPPGYHKQAVGPPDPRMKAPTILMCVPDKPEPKEQKEPKPDSPEKGNR